MLAGVGEFLRGGVVALAVRSRRRPGPTGSTSCRLARSRPGRHPGPPAASGLAAGLLSCRPLRLKTCGQQAGREGELVAFARQGQRLDVAQRQERGQIVLARTPRSSDGRSVRICSITRCLPSARSGLHCSEANEAAAVPRSISVEAEARCVVLRREAGQFIGPRLAGQWRAVIVGGQRSSRW